MGLLFGARLLVALLFRGWVPSGSSARTTRRLLNAVSVKGEPGGVALFAAGCVKRRKLRFGFPFFGRLIIILRNTGVLSTAKLRVWTLFGHWTHSAKCLSNQTALFWNVFRDRLELWAFIFWNADGFDGSSVWVHGPIS